LKPNQAKRLLELHDSGSYTQAELAEVFGVGRSTVYRTIERIRPKPPVPGRPFANLAHQGVNQRPADRAAEALFEYGEPTSGAPVDDLSDA
jgi:hypothetical protein